MESLKISRAILMYWCIFSTNSENNEIYYCENCDIIIGALAPIHNRIENPSSWQKHVNCGKTIREHAIPRVEAMLYAIDTINSAIDLLPGVKLGLHVLDTCGIPNVGTNEAKKFIDITCKDKLKGNTPYVAGVVGAMYSSVSIDVAKFLTPWHIPLISPASTSAKLNDKVGFPLFARTVPSDTYQNRVIVDILERLDWKLITTIVSEEFSGQGLADFRDMAQKRGICNFLSETLPSKQYKKEKADNHIVKIICKILLHTDSNVIVLLTNDDDTISILNAKHRVQSSSSFSGSISFSIVSVGLEITGILPKLNALNAF